MSRLTRTGHSPTPAASRRTFRAATASPLGVPGSVRNTRPTIGSGLNVTLLTYIDTCCLGINVDTAAIPDYDVFHDVLVDGFDEVLALAR